MCFQCIRELENAVFWSYRLDCPPGIEEEEGTANSIESLSLPAEGWETSGGFRTSGVLRKDPWWVWHVLG